MNKKLLCHPRHIPRWLISYRVVDEIKKYLVCESCFEMNCFHKHVVNKEDIQMNLVHNITM